MKPLRRLSHSLRNNAVIIFATIGLLISIGAILYYLDVTFQQEKNSFIVANPKRFFTDIRQTYVNQLTELSIQVLTKGTPQNYLELKKIFEKIVDNPQNIIYSIELYTNTNSPKLSYENKSKYYALNNWSNSLISRRFSHLSQIGLTLGETEYGRLVAYYASPENVPEIEQLTERYRWYAILIPLCFIGIYGLGLKWFLLPVRRVVDHLADTELGVVNVIDKPHTLIENEYNRMAWNTMMLAVNLEIADFVAANPNLSIEDTLLHINRIIEQKMGYGQVALGILNTATQQFEIYLPNNAHQDSSRFQLTQPIFDDLRYSVLNSTPIIINRESEAETVFDYFKSKSFIACPVSAKESISEFIIVSNRNQHRFFSDQDVQALKHISQQINLALQKKEFQRQLIDQEKNQVSINLARNLGHDLTNVIAATRWDLNTLDSLLTQLDSTAISTAQRDLITEAVSGLTNNTEFLQEIVDIYRAFSYLKKPKYEPTDLNALLQQMIELFRLSTAGKVKFVTEFMDVQMMIAVEPRLIKLAVFNLLTNALEAVKLASVAQSIDGIITLHTERNQSRSGIKISIRDNGRGIRDESGNLMPEEQTNRLFQHGYSTKEKDAAGGLGLAWVQTIVSEFHNGKIYANNNPEGGACFTIELPDKNPTAE
ncbi:MAG: sensor histidine kinase [bacterium]